MESLRIARVRARYRVPSPAAEHKARLDALLARPVQDALEVAVARAGVPVHEEVCVRRVHSRTRLRLDRPDGALAADWGMVLAEELRDVLARGGPDVVRYGSRAHAFVDALTASVRGDFRRAWAWRQMGLCRTAGGAPAAAGLKDLLHALAGEARAAAAVVAAVARAGALPALVEAAGDGAWATLASAALAASGASAALAAPPSVEPEDASGLGHGAPRIETVVAAVSARSAIAAAVVQRPEAVRTSEFLRRALAALAVLEVDPIVLARADSIPARVLAKVARLLVRDDGAGVPVVRGARELDDRDNAPAARDSIPPLPARFEPTRPVREPAAPPARVSRTDPQEATSEVASRGIDATSEAGPHGRLAADAREESVAIERPGAPVRAASVPEAATMEAEPEAVVPSVRTRARTRAGGLMFLLNVVDEVGLPARVGADARLAERSWPWFLHRLAATLVPDVDEPAALAFAGLPPDADPPDANEPPSGDGERTALDECRALVVEALHRRLRRDVPDAGLVAWTCLRPAEIVADPGWIDVRFALDQACTEIRRSGLDRDPGWLPWLGVVVRFLYV